MSGAPAVVTAAATSPPAAVPAGTGLVDLGLAESRVFLAVCTFLAGVHAYRKLSPYFAVTWFGSGFVFGFLWGRGSAAPESVLLPVLVVYLAAAVTKGLVETAGGVRGNHLVHVLMTGLFSGCLALPFESASRALGLPLPRSASRLLLGFDGAWLGGVTLDAVWMWTVVGTVFYGAYKVLDHIGLNREVQTVALFASPPATVWLAERIYGLV